MLISYKDFLYKNIKEELKGMLTNKTNKIQASPDYAIADL